MYIFVYIYRSNFVEPQAIKPCMIALCIGSLQVSLRPNTRNPWPRCITATSFASGLAVFVQETCRQIDADEVLNNLTGANWVSLVDRVTGLHSPYGIGRFLYAAHSGFCFCLIFGHLIWDVEAMPLVWRVSLCSHDARSTALAGYVFELDRAFFFNVKRWKR